jgi:hypothetical protein
VQSSNVQALAFGKRAKLRWLFAFWQKASFSFAARQTLHTAKPCFTRGARFTAAKPQLH